MLAKLCKKCKIEKPLSDFYKHAYNKDGRRGLCKVCYTQQCGDWLKSHPAFSKDYRQQKKSQEKIIISEKVCRGCEINKHIDEFYKSAYEKDGYQTYCKSCKQNMDKKYWNANKDKLKKSHKIYYEDHKEDINKYRKTETYKIKKRKQDHEWYHKKGGKQSYVKYTNKHPWVRAFRGIKKRCTQINSKSYKYYGAKGIKCLISLEEVRLLYLRDDADFMQKPCMHRIDSKGNYTIDNCCFVEEIEHKQIHKEVGSKR